jgi:hypothetical protein
VGTRRGHHPSWEAGSRRDRRRTSQPTDIVDAVTKAATARRHRIRHTAGIGARPLILLSRVLPDRVFDTLIKRLEPDESAKRGRGGCRGAKPPDPGGSRG